MSNPAQQDNDTRNGLGFGAWFAKVNKEVFAISGVGVDDIGDVSYWDMWDAGKTPRDAAREALEQADFPFEED